MDRARRKPKLMCAACRRKVRGVKTVYPGGIIVVDDPGRSATLQSLLYRMTQGFRITSGGTQQIDVRDLAGFFIVALLEKMTANQRAISQPVITWRGETFANLLDDISGKNYRVVK